MHQLRKVDAEDLEYLAVHRALARRFRAHESVLDEIKSFVVPTGGSALDATRLQQMGLTGAVRSVDGYLPMPEVELLQARFGLVDDPAGNVTLRGVTVEDAFHDGTTPLAAVVLDLAGSLVTKERAAGLREAATLIEAVAA
jgi:hypothetical protein